MPAKGNPITIRTAVKDKAVAFLLANNTNNYFNGLTGLAYFPTNITALRNVLPCLTVDFSYPDASTYQRTDQLAIAQDFLQISYFHRIASSDPNGAVANDAVQYAIWLLEQYLSANQSLWMTVDGSRLYTKRIEDLNIEIAGTSGVATKFGWLTLQTDYRVTPRIS